MIASYDSWTGETTFDSGEFVKIPPNASQLLGVRTAETRPRQFAMQYDEAPVFVEPMRPILDQIESYMDFLVRQRPMWKDVVIDSVPVINRLYADWDNDYRIFLHRIDRPEAALSGKGVLHYHQWQSIARMHRGMYRELLAFGEPTSPAGPVVHSMEDVGPGSVREYLHPHLWHSIEPISETTYSTMVVKKQSWRTPVPITSHTSSLVYPQLRKDVRNSIFEHFEEIYPAGAAY